LITTMKNTGGAGRTLTVLPHVCSHRPFILLY
jgi:hypothetical protein